MSRRLSKLFRRAFTLIELLIVVAIIAILAAIAVPNFLEAQVRSKVSRVKADMRTMATALESYCIDNNQYPPCEKPSALGTDPKLYLWRLTTPIAFLSSFPTDPFDTMGTFGGQGSLGQFTAPRTTYIYYRFIKNYDYTSAQSSVTKLMKKGVRWSLTTVGPSRNYPTSRLGQNWILTWNILAGWYGDVNGSWLYIYDPTNGTNSRGYIIDTNMGMADGKLCGH